MELQKKSQLSARQIKATLLHVEGMSKKDIAKTLGVEPHTISEWFKHPEFNELIDSHLHEVEAESLVRLRSLRRDAIESLKHLIKVGTPSSRLAAIRTVLENTPARPRSHGERFSDSLFKETLSMFEHT
jgi:predicted transcriptional regulator